MTDEEALCAPAAAPTVSIFRTTIVPLALLIVCPPVVLMTWVVVTKLDGSLTRAASTGITAIMRSVPRPDLAAVEMLGVFAALELALLLFLPGETIRGPVTPAGNRPTYRLNGVSAYVITFALFFVGAGLGWFPASIVYDHFGPLLTTLCLFALVFCLVLYAKGHLAPTNGDRVITGNVIFDYFQGTELHPRILGVDLKQLCNCRLSMMGWAVTVVSFAAAQRAQLGHVTAGMAIAVGLQVAYLFKFFVWEGGYFASLDITHDRFGFYICWGVLCWVPCLYTLSTLFLVGHPTALTPLAATGIAVLGVTSLLVNYLADRQRQVVRRRGGKTTVWGRRPVLIHAYYRTRDGAERENLLLASGFWGLARHFHYVPELLLALAWTLPAGFTHALPYAYFVFLFILLVDRAGRDDRRCAAKYGDAWSRYRRAVPYKIIPGVY